MLLPLPRCYIKSSYGDYLHHRNRDDGYRHAGVDLYSLNKPYIFSPANGEIVEVAKGIKNTGFGGYGPYIVVIRDKKYYYHWLAHLTNVFVIKGQSISEGDFIGTIADNKHLHYEVRTQKFTNTFPWKITVDPLSYLGIVRSGKYPEKLESDKMETKSDYELLNEALIQDALAKQEKPISPIGLLIIGGIIAFVVFS